MFDFLLSGLAVARFDNVAVAVGVTSMVTLVLVPPARVPMVQVTVPEESEQPALDVPASKVTPAGSVSLTVTPGMGELPPLLTVTT